MSNKGSYFFWSDWDSEESLKISSLAAQGLWMRLLCVAAKSDPTGYVAVNGRPLGVTDISRLAGVPETECEPLLLELERNGVFSRTRNGTIYSRRMVRDAKKAEIASKNGKKGGNPSLCKQTEISSSVNPQDMVDHKPPIPIPIPKPKPILNNQRSNDTPRAREPTDEFDRLDAALRSLPGIEKHPVAANLDISPIYRLVQEGHDFRKKLRPLMIEKLKAATAKRKTIKTWSYFEAALRESLNGATAPLDDEKWRRLLVIGRESKHWQCVKYGPIPGHPGCRVPVHLLLPGDGEGWTEWRAVA
jgi:hypothetical protein